MRTQKDDQLIEQAIKFLVHSIVSSGNNPKPVIIHSFRVAMILEQRGVETPIVVAAFLHDVLEDTSAKKEDIQKKFGNEVLAIVESLTFDKSISDKKGRYIDAMNRCKEKGYSALIIRASDILDNNNYYPLAKDRETLQFLLEKMKYFIDVSAIELKNESLWLDLNKAYSSLLVKFEQI